MHNILQYWQTIIIVVIKIHMYALVHYAYSLSKKYNNIVIVRKALFYNNTTYTLQGDKNYMFYVIFSFLYNIREINREKSIKHIIIIMQ